MMINMFLINRKFYADVLSIYKYFQCLMFVLENPFDIGLHFMFTTNKIVYRLNAMLNISDTIPIFCNSKFIVPFMTTVSIYLTYRCNIALNLNSIWSWILRVHYALLWVTI